MGGKSGSVYWCRCEDCERRVREFRPECFDCIPSLQLLSTVNLLDKIMNDMFTKNRILQGGFARKTH